MHSLRLLPFLLLAALPAFAQSQSGMTPEQAEKQRAAVTHDNNVAINEAQQRTQRTLEDLSLLFPDYVKTPPACTRAALSNYIEDVWNRTAKDVSCPPDNLNCPQASAAHKKFAEVLDNMHMNAKRKAQSLLSVDAVVITSTAYNYILPVTYALVPDNKIDSFNPNYIHTKEGLEVTDIPADALKSRLGDLDKFLAACDPAKPQPWAVPGTSYTEHSETILPQWKLGLYSILMQNVIGSKLPDDKKGYVGCLVRLNIVRTEYRKCGDDKQCLATVPADDKAKLMQALDDLKAHDCNLAATKKNAYMLEGGNGEAPPFRDEQPEIDAAKKVQLELVKARVTQQRLLDDLGTFFGKALPYSGACYRAALSDYIEDQWNKVSTALHCSADTTCDGISATTVSSGDRLKDVARGQLRDRADARLQIANRNQFMIGKKIFDYLRPLDFYLEPNDRIDSFNGKPSPDKKTMGVPEASEDELKKRNEELKQYLAGCNTRKPAPWAVAGAAQADGSLPSTDAIKLGTYGMLVKTVIGSEVPADKAGYVGCMSMFADAQVSTCGDNLKCYDTIPALKHDDLERSLQQLKANQCSKDATAVIARGAQSVAPAK